MDISGVSPLRNKPLRITKFVADVHLGRLAKYLRMCGFDTYFDTDLSDNQIIGISLKERRIILTRDRELLKNKLVTHGYWIRSMKPEKQLKEVLQKFDLKSKLNPFVRCLECNGMIEDVNKKDIKERLLQKTKDFYTEFRRCKICGNIYWEGSHYERMKKFIEAL
jgi:uncharacterized protein with PIN domain